MSIEAVRAVLDIRTSVLTTAERFVLLAFAERSRTDESGVLVAWPSVTTVALETGLARGYVQECLRTLQHHGLIQQTGNRRSRVNVYRLRLNVIRAWHHDAPPTQAEVSGELTGHGGPTAVVSGDLMSSCQVSRQDSVSSPDTEPVREPVTEPDTSSPLATASIVEAAFGEFWAAYPRRVGKAAALKAYTKAVKSGVSPELILAGVHRYVEADPRRPMKYTVHPTTWLNQGRWDDDTDALTPDGSGSNVGETFEKHWANGGGF